MTEAYGSHANPDLLSRIPLDAALVLDVGAGAGGLGAAYRRRNPAARLVAIEADEALAAEAARHYDEVHRLDIEATAPPIAPGTLDAWVLGDVLEHLRDPWAVLKRDAALLAPDGVLLACVPNIEHWSFAARLLAGRWRYDAMGLFDRSHLRWFTRDGMKEALEQAGLVPLEAAPRIVGREKVETFARQVEPTLRAMGVDPADWLRRSAPLQYVWRATRAAPKPMVVVARTLKPVGGVNDVRVLEPFAAMATRPGIVTRAGMEAALPKLDAEIPRVMVLQRRLLDHPEAPGYLRALRATGAVLVQEFDDDPAHWPSIAASGSLAFRGVHAVQTSTAPLAALLRELNPEVAIFPNALSALPEPRNFTDPARLTLFFGAINREADVAPFIPALNRALAEAGPRLSIAVMHDRRTFEALDTPHKSFAPLADYATYRAAMGRCELAFLPLADTRFNRMKSDLKAVEAGGHRLCCLASPTVYEGSIRHGETGLIVRSPEEVVAALRDLVADPARARAMADAAHGWVKRERLHAHQVAARIAWYRGLWERRAELDAALLERVPAVG
ncbi:class I SAM-dependent methyltransferase [Falsiroseomonas ponticola]|uniref:class I SAM-dependent methyltransferase n=1 Tax=Falsiroseomonas ponticola TaxID=2786951 RepID=UPI001931432C|nr:class I SAM-dependent methyltransferase [Roseomonas ponticola]